MKQAGHGSIFFSKKSLAMEQNRSEQGHKPELAQKDKYNSEHAYDDDSPLDQRGAGQERIAARVPRIGLRKGRG